MKRVMTTRTKNSTHFLHCSGLALLIVSQSSLAENRVVVVPMPGDDIEVYRGTTRTGNSTCSVYAQPPGNWVTDINCSNVAVDGQDAEIRAGVNITPRFVIENGVVSDQATGLNWLRKADCAGITASWSDALAYVIELNADGNMAGSDCADSSAKGGSHQADWRLPNIKELQTLFDYGFHGSPFLPDTAGSGQWSEGNPFTGIKTDFAYWSSTSYGIVLDDALRANFDDGSTDWTSKAALQHVWAVRNSTR